MLNRSGLPLFRAKGGLGLLFFQKGGSEAQEKIETDIDENDSCLVKKPTMMSLLPLFKTEAKEEMRNKSKEAGNNADTHFFLLHHPLTWAKIK